MREPALGVRYCAEKGTTALTHGMRYGEHIMRKGKHEKFHISADPAAQLLSLGSCVLDNGAQTQT